MVLAAGWAGALTAQTTSYHIGNSLTQDSQPTGIAEMADRAGLDHLVGRHIRCGSSLRGILENPDDLCVDPLDGFGTFATALPNHHWDYVTIQTHPERDSTLGEDVASAVELIELTRSNPANADTRFYLFSAWPSFFQYEKNWYAPVLDHRQTRTVHAKHYYDYFLRRVREQTDAEVYMVPVGETLAELSRRIDEEQIPDLPKLSLLYRDTRHLQYTWGRFVAGLTTFTTLFGIDPEGFTKPPGHYGPDDAFPPELIDAFNDAVRQVVATHPYTNVRFPVSTQADFNASGVVEGGDLAEWGGSFGVIPGADVDRDVDVDGADFLLWQRLVATAEETLPPPHAFDLDDSGYVDGGDLSGWMNGFGHADAAGDFSGDQLGNGVDLLAWQRELTAYPAADFDLDRAVGGRDLAIWGDSFGDHQRGDALRDRSVDGKDFLSWQREHGWLSLSASGRGNATSTPTPTSGMFAALAAFAWVARGRGVRRERARRGVEA